MRIEPAPKPAPPPRYHARQQLGAEAYYPGGVTARLVIPTLAEWKEIEKILLQRGYKPY